MTKNIFGLTGGIGSGKTTLANFLTKIDKNIEVFDCDQIAKEIMAEEAKKSGIVFNRKKIAEIIFNNPIEKEKVEKLIHPKVWQKLDEVIKKSNENSIILVESAILFDIGKEKDIPNIIATICNLDERKKRIRTRNNWSEAEIEARIKNQISDETLVKKATVIVDTNCSLDQLKEKSEKLYRILTNWKNEKLTL